MVEKDIYDLYDEQKANIQVLEQEKKKLKKDLEEVAALILTTGYTVNDKNERVMDANEYVWLDRAAEILRKYHKRK